MPPAVETKRPPPSQRTHVAAAPHYALIRAKKLTAHVQRGPSKGHTVTLRRGDKVRILDRNDRMTMGSSIECRVPFLDYRLVEGLAALRTADLVGYGRSKMLLRSAVGARLPRAVLRQPKWGFGVPWAEHLRRVPELRDAVAALPSSQPISDGPFERAALNRVVASFLAGSARWDALVRQLLMINLWYAACVASQPHGRHQVATFA